MYALYIHNQLNIHLPKTVFHLELFHSWYVRSEYLLKIDLEANQVKFFWYAFWFTYFDKANGNQIKWKQIALYSISNAFYVHKTTVVGLYFSSAFYYQRWHYWTDLSLNDFLWCVVYVRGWRLIKSIGCAPNAHTYTSDENVSFC